MNFKNFYILLTLIFCTNSFASESGNTNKNANFLYSDFSELKSLKSKIENQHFVIDGRIQLDLGAPVKNDINNTNNISSSARRLWLGASGLINKDFSYRIITGFESSQTRVHDAFIKYQGFKNTDILIGNFFENSGLDISSGNLVTPLIERSSSITTFKRFRRLGISVNPYGENWGLHFGIFGNNFSNPNSSAANANNRGHGISSRGHIDLINDKKNSHSLHIGINSSYRWLSHGTNSTLGSNRTMQFSSSGNSNVLSTTLINTGRIVNVSNFNQNMLELRYQKGSLTVTSEYMKTTLNRSSASDVNFSGGYLMASYFISGEKYGYDPQQGIQTIPTIGNSGAWEVASRYSTTNLNDGNIRGGKLYSYDFGVNYYPSNNLKLMANYIFNKTDSAARVTQNPQYLMFRTQINF